MTLHETEFSSTAPCIFGEILYDCFPDGHEVLGGAPLNVAWHLQGFGYSPLVISRVGKDDLGQRALNTLRSWGMATRGIQEDATHPTGTAEVRIHDGHHTFELVANRAYDHISVDSALQATSGRSIELLYHGTLALRGLPSAHALEVLLETTGSPIFLDINLRAPWWKLETVEAILRRARWAKVNEDELAILDASSASSKPQQAAAELVHRNELDWLIVTLGSAGAFLIDAQDHIFETQPVSTESPVDTVGAGDAFSSVAIAGLFRGWSHESILSRASDFATQICMRRGAIPNDPQLYKDTRESWLKT